MTSKVLQPEHQGPRAALALVRRVLGWLLVAVLAVDLVSSPLHAHRHNGEWAAAGALAVSSAHADHLSDHLSGAGSADGGSHADHDDAGAFSHSIVALRTPVDVKADGEPADDNPAEAPWYTPAPRLPAEPATAVLRPDRRRAGFSAFRSLPPHGRAPPLHA